MIVFPGNGFYSTGQLSRQDLSYSATYTQHLFYENYLIVAKYGNSTTWTRIKENRRIFLNIDRSQNTINSRQIIFLSNNTNTSYVE